MSALNDKYHRVFFLITYINKTMIDFSFSSQCLRWRLPSVKVLSLTHSFYRSYSSRWQYSIRHKQVGIKRTKIRNGEYWVGGEWLKAWTITKILIQIFLFTICCTHNSFVNVFQFGFDRLWVSSGEFIHIILQSKVPISVFDEVNAIESTDVAVLGLN
jgi:hypothetical protein